MKLENIPAKEKFDQLVKGLAELEPIAAELAKNKIHSQSPHIGAVRMRLLTAIKGLGWHTEVLAALPDPESAPAKTVKQKPSAADATAGARAPK